MLRYLILPVLLFSGDGEPANLPGGGSRQVLEPVQHTVDDIGIVSTGAGFIVLGPVTTPPTTTNDPLVLEAEWIDREGVTHRVRTPVKSVSQIDLYLKRHDAVIQAYKAIYPPAPVQDPRTGGEILIDVRQQTKAEHGHSRNLPGGRLTKPHRTTQSLREQGGRLEGDRLVRTVTEHRPHLMTPDVAALCAAYPNR